MHVHFTRAPTKYYRFRLCLIGIDFARAVGRGRALIRQGARRPRPFARRSRINIFQIPFRPRSPPIQSTAAATVRHRRPARRVVPPLGVPGARTLFARGARCRPARRARRKRCAERKGRIKERAPRVSAAPPRLPCATGRCAGPRRSTECLGRAPSLLRDHRHRHANSAFSCSPPCHPPKVTVVRAVHYTSQATQLDETPTPPPTTPARWQLQL